MRKVFFIIVLLNFWLSANNYAQNNISITGKIVNNKYFTNVYLDDIRGEIAFGSDTIVESGTFKIEASIKQTDFFKLQFSEEANIYLVLVPGENITIEIDADSLTNPVINGSKNSKLVYDLLSELRAYQQQMEEATKIIEVKKSEFVKRFIGENPKSLSTLFLVQEINLEEDYDLYAKLLTDLHNEYPENLFVNELYGQVAQQEQETLAIGSDAPEITLPDKDGKNTNLSSLRGKYVLIDFWASWCRPCREESPNMVKLYKDFKRKGFEIYGVSLDEDKEAWLTAIKKDKLEWTQVSDLKGWASEAGKTYNVEGIPFTVLLDKEGKVVAKGLRGDELRAKLDELLK